MRELRRLLPEDASGTGLTVTDLARAAYGTGNDDPSPAQRSAVARAIRRLVETGVANSTTGLLKDEQFELFFLAPGVPPGDYANIAHPDSLREPIIRT